MSPEHNSRRCHLIDKEIDGTISAAEIIELLSLQEEMLAHRKTVAPLPIEETKQVLESIRLRNVS